MDKASEERILNTLPLLNERQRRLYLANEAKAIGHGGIKQVSKASGVSRVAVTQGLKEAREAGCNPLTGNRSRKAGGGRKPIIQEGASHTPRA
jgi:hypothetical protein